VTKPNTVETVSFRTVQAKTLKCMEQVYSIFLEHIDLMKLRCGGGLCFKAAYSLVMIKALLVRPDIIRTTIFTQSGSLLLVFLGTQAVR